MNRFFVCATLATICLFNARFAMAHAYPAHQDPAAGASVSASTNTVSIEFDEGLEPAFSTIAVTDPQGKSVTSAKAIVDPADKKHLSVKLNALSAGTYTVAWVAVAVDGHRTQGHYPFTVK